MGSTSQLCRRSRPARRRALGDELHGVEIVAVGERGGAAIEGDRPGEAENGQRGQRHDDQFGGAEEGLAGDQVPDAAPGPRQYRRRR